MQFKFLINIFMHQKEVVEIIKNYGPLTIDLISIYYIQRIISDMKKGEVVNRGRMIAGIAFFVTTIAANLPLLITKFNK
jgi:hypothetical protein